MKKLLALLLSALLALAMCVALAEDAYDNAATIQVGKVYTLTNDGTSNPEETFAFTTSVESVTDSQYTASDITSNFPLTVNTISFAEGEATTAGDRNTVTVNIPQIDKVGIYTYKIVETAGSTAGVTYDSEPIYLKVTVIVQDGELVRVVSLRDDTTDGNKIGGTDYDETETSDGDTTGNEEAYGGFQNTYSAGDLEISKTVTGNLGDTEKYFAVKITLTGEVGKTYQPIVVDGGSNASNPETITVGEEATLQFKSGDTITIKNIPYGVTYTVVEDDYSSDGYTAETVYSDDENKKIDSEKDTVAITNDKSTEIDTGVVLERLPYIALLVLVAAAVIVLFIRRHSFSED